MVSRILSSTQNSFIEPDGRLLPEVMILGKQAKKRIKAATFYPELQKVQFGHLYPLRYRVTPAWKIRKA